MEKAGSKQGEMLKDNLSGFCGFIEPFFFFSKVILQQSWYHSTAAGGHFVEQRHFGAILSV